MSKYVGRIIFRRKFPLHPDFEKLDSKNEQAVPAWWTSLRPKFEKDGGRKQKNKSSDCIYGGPNIRPLYYKCSDAPMIASDKEIADFVSSIDLRSILKKLMVKAIITHAKLGPMQQRAILAVLLQAAGRAGEPKFVDINNWVYDPRWEVTDILWFEPKTSTIQTMPMLVSKGEYEACFYHSLGSYWACEAGLSRDTSQTDIESFLFPAFHDVLDTTVADKIAAMIQSNLPANCPKKLKKQYTGKSIRKAAITTMLMDPDSSFTDCAGRSGHASGTQLDSYEDKMNIAIAIRGGKILAGYKPNAVCHVPRLDCLPSDDVARFEDKVFINDVPDLKPTGHLYAVLRICLAVLIMHHNRVERDLGPECAIVKKLYEAARQANITDVRYPNAATGVIVQKWSDEMWDYFIDVNPDIVKVSADGSNQAIATNQLSQIAVAQSQTLARLEGKLDILLQEREKDKQRMTEQDQ